MMISLGRPLIKFSFRREWCVGRGMSGAGRAEGGERRGHQGGHSCKKKTSYELMNVSGLIDEAKRKCVFSTVLFMGLTYIRMNRK